MLKCNELIRKFFLTWWNKTFQNDSKLHLIITQYFIPIDYIIVSVNLAKILLFVHKMVWKKWHEYDKK